VVPAAHYCCGGALTTADGATNIRRLYAAGEVAMTGLHGANRLASNSLLEGLVFADRAGHALADEAGRTGYVSAVPEVPAEPDTGADPGFEETRRQMRELMTANVGVQRTEASLLHAEQELGRLTRQTPAAAWRTHNQLLVASLITQAARRRRESRGGHRRLDYPPAGRRRETA
jgi:L-aspartate oxidase